MGEWDSVHAINYESKAFWDIHWIRSANDLPYQRESWNSLMQKMLLIFPVCGGFKIIQTLSQVLRQSWYLHQWVDISEIIGRVNFWAFHPDFVPMHTVYQSISWLLHQLCYQDAPAGPTIKNFKLFGFDRLIHSHADFIKPLNNAVYYIVKFYEIFDQFPSSCLKFRFEL